jgi:uncharacterized membrane protein
VPLILALSSAAFYGIADFLGGLGARRAPPLAATLFAQGVGRASTVLLARVVLGVRLGPMQSIGLACAAIAIVLITTR